MYVHFVFLRLATLLVGHGGIHAASVFEHCNASLTLIVHLCREVHAVNLDVSIFVRTKEEEQRAVILFFMG